MLRVSTAIRSGLLLISLAAGTAHSQIVQVFPTAPAQIAPNSAPWTVGAPAGITVHQVFDGSLFANATGGAPARIERITFSGTVTGHIALRLGYTTAIPGAPECGAGGLDIPDASGGGAPNATGPMHTFFENDIVSLGSGPASFGMIYDGTPFVYNPALGNLLLEIHMPVRSGGTGSQNSAITLEASRTYQVHGGASSSALVGIQAMRVEFTFSAFACYPNCDGSAANPVLTGNDFQCFINSFAAGNAYANCDGSTLAPTLTANDFLCFINSFAAGCS